MTAQVTSHLQRHVPIPIGWEQDGDRDTLLGADDETVPGQLWERLGEYSFAQMVSSHIDLWREALDRLK